MNRPAADPASERGTIRQQRAKLIAERNKLEWQFDLHPDHTIAVLLIAYGERIAELTLNLATAECGIDIDTAYEAEVLS